MQLFYVKSRGSLYKIKMPRHRTIRQTVHSCDSNTVKLNSAFAGAKLVMVFGMINHSLASICEPELKPGGGLGSAARLRAGLNAAFRCHTATVWTGQRHTVAVWLISVGQGGNERWRGEWWGSPAWRTDERVGKVGRPGNSRSVWTGCAFSPRPRLWRPAPSETASWPGTGYA